MIRIRDLQLTYASGFQLRVDQLDVQPGEKVAIVGPSGSGKSTLLKLLAGVLLPDGGSIESHGVSVQGLSSTARRRWRARSIGFVFQEFELLEYLTAAENILLPFRLGLTSARDFKSRLHDLAAAVAITSKLDRRPGQLSQGERQRVALCRALITQPGIVLADEPTGSLDPVAAQEAVNLLVDQVSRLGSILIAVTHDHSLLTRFDRIIQLPLEP